MSSTRTVSPGALAFSSWRVTRFLVYASEQAPQPPVSLRGAKGDEAISVEGIEIATPLARNDTAGYYLVLKIYGVSLIYVNQIMIEIPSVRTEGEIDLR